MPRLLSYSLVVLIGVFAGLLAAAQVIHVFSFATATWLLYACSFLALLVGTDLLLSREGMRSIFHYGTAAAACVALFAMTTILSLIFWMASALTTHVGLTVLRALVTAWGVNLRVVATSSVLAFVPLYSFLAVFVVMVLFEFFAPRRRFWQRTRAWLMEDWRGRLTPAMFALIMDAVAFSILLREWEFLILVAMCLAVMAALPILDRLFSRSRIWAVARQTIAEAMHYKVVVVWVVVMLLMIVVLPRIVAGDGLTLKSRVQGYLNFSLVLVGWGLGVLTVGLAAYTLPNEIFRKLIFMTTSKPIPRWQIFAGKWVGIGVLNAGLLLFSGVTIWGFTEYMRKLPTQMEGDRTALEAEVLSVRHAVPLEEPADLKTQAEQIVRKQRQADQISAEQEAEKVEAKLAELKQSWRQLPPGSQQMYVFHNLMVDRTKRDEFLHIRIKPNSNSGVDNLFFPVVYWAGDRDDANTQTPVVKMDVPAERSTIMVLPVWAVNSQGNLYFYMANLSRRDTMTFESNDTFELLYGLGTFHWNLVRAMSIIWCRLAFLAALGLVFSSFLSFPVAFMATVFGFIICQISSYTAEAIDSASARVGNKDPIWGPLNLGYVLNPIGKGVVWLLPNFSKYDALENVVDGRLVPLMWVIMSFTWLVLFWCLLLGLIGCATLTSRELAREGT